MKILNYLAGLILSAALLLAIVLGFGLHDDLFRRALTQNTDLPQTVAADFAYDTMSYLSGRQEGWNASAILEPVGIAPSEAFTRHMAEVRGMVQGGRIALWGLLTALVLLLTLILPRGRLSSGILCGGLLTPLLLCLLIGAWALLDFDGFWYRLHTVFIPGGIFSASEPIMKLFPSRLFSSYAVCILPTYLISVSASVFLTVRLQNLHRKRKPAHPDCCSRYNQP